MVGVWICSVGGIGARETSRSDEREDGDRRECPDDRKTGGTRMAAFTYGHGVLPRRSYSPGAGGNRHAPVGGFRYPL